ncbi:hypothetical protein QJS10_CPB21g00864 [Acorus calamus]|uniref:Uncharacterized protein n=1 Tax=Acorus calamus TaxID=4465 RepID=A0AAV9C2N0_ACOCL|nr:hypothetical protein QJS10_CPB21g00864 [Acorus calamus]
MTQATAIHSSSVDAVKATAPPPSADESRSRHPRSPPPLPPLGPDSARDRRPPGGPREEVPPVATGEVFLGLASFLLRDRGASPADRILMAPPPSDLGSPGSAVVEDPVEPGVVWEQAPEDVEAEKERRAVTSPGFSFSAAAHHAEQ